MKIGLQCLVVRRQPDVSQEHIVSIVRVKECAKQEISKRQALRGAASVIFLWVIQLLYQ
jgi:hypothetical protein